MCGRLAVNALCFQCAVVNALLEAVPFKMPVKKVIPFLAQFFDVFGVFPERAGVKHALAEAVRADFAQGDERVKVMIGLVAFALRLTRRAMHMQIDYETSGCFVPASNLSSRNFCCPDFPHRQ